MAKQSNAAEQQQNLDPFDDDFDKAQERRGGQYMEPGTYEVTIDACKIIKSGKKKGVLLWVTEFTIDKVLDGKMLPGTQASQVISFEHLSAQGNVRTFVARATGAEFESVTKEHCRGCATVEQPLKGTKMKLVCKVIKTKEKQTDFTTHDWSLIRDAA